MNAEISSSDARSENATCARWLQHVLAQSAECYTSIDLCCEGTGESHDAILGHPWGDKKLRAAEALLQAGMEDTREHEG
jgi:hypothetical protein